MRRVCIVIVVLLLLSCRNDKGKWKTLDFGVFKLTTPKEWKAIKQQGIDSYVGGLTNYRDTLWFDYGRYGVNLNQSLYPNNIATDTVNGLIGEISIPKYSIKGFYSLFISRVNETDKFTIYGNSIITQKEVILRIFKSLVFIESDTLKNPVLSESKFSKSLRASGETLFKNNCANCHKIDYDYSGPALRERFEVRDREWVYLFLTNQHQIKNDSMRNMLKKKYEFKCQGYPDLTREEVYAIYNYCY
jgi:Cytochrome c